MLFILILIFGSLGKNNLNFIFLVEISECQLHFENEAYNGPIKLKTLDNLVRNEFTRGFLRSCCTKCYFFDPVDDTCAARCFGQIFSDDFFWN